MRRALVLLVLLLVPGAGQAKWLEASSDHFVVYADDRPDNLKGFSDQLERFNAAVTGLLGMDELTPSPSNRITVYIVRSDTQVRKLAGDDGSKFAYAFYIPRAGGSIAIVPRVEAGGKGGDIDFSLYALLHEFVHHITLSSSRAVLPVWIVEGSAEFFASARFERDGAVSLGMPATFRAGELFYAKNVPLDRLFAPDMQKRARQSDSDNFYGRSWLLFHYLTFSRERAGQLRDYLAKVTGGMGSLEAARAVFGDFRTLDRELDDYLNKRTMTTLKMPAATLKIGPVNLRELSEGEAAMMPVHIRSKRGVDRKQALALLPEARDVAARYPDDPGVLSALAEAEHDAGNYKESIAAADAALARDPTRANAYVQKGFSMFALAAKADDKVGAFNAARAPFIALNKRENDHPLPLLYYYLSFTSANVPPDKTAVAALRRASELAPFDLELHSMMAMQALRDGDREEAIANLQPIAYDPHGGLNAERARAEVEKLQAGAAPDAVLADLRKPLPKQD